MKKIARWAVLWFLLGEQYFVLEAIYRFAFKGGQRAHIAMLAVGGLAVLAVGAVNQSPRFYKAPVVVQSLIGTAITLAIEFAGGYILNIRMGLAIWDYSGMIGNIAGQICLPFAAIWFALMPAAIWLEDFARWKLWREGQVYTLKSIYRDLLTGG
jgi:hypothetical protein